MAPLLPDRFHIEVRLGRVDDVEAWLATDEMLDRPVMVEWLGPEASPQRKAQFLAAFRAAAGVSHDHLASVFAADDTGQGAYAVSEWTGGVSVADRIKAGETIPVEDFLPNAAGLADALAALHEAGVVHGAIGPDTIQFAAAHPGKISGFGKSHQRGDQLSDTKDLSLALIEGIVGGPTDLPPSQVAQGLSSAVDEALIAAADGRMSATDLAAALRASPSSAPSRERRAGSRLWLAIGAGLLVAAVAIIVAGFLIDTGSESPFLFPAGPVATTPELDPTSAAPTTSLPASAGQLITVAAAYDPFGDGVERNSDIFLLADGDTSTGWRTERYFDPLRSIKGGVGVSFATTGTPTVLDMTASDGLRYAIQWAEQIPADFSVWEEVASGTVVGGSATIQLPARVDGHWLIWLTDLPANDEFFFGYLYEIQFRP
ncbi:MAG: hypothetical protein OEM22_00020 [Acidimicrobiia bacterium]|nr:hypothetical protein [Acidimicrobiia bacterium]